MSCISRRKGRRKKKKKKLLLPHVKLLHDELNGTATARRGLCRLSPGTSRAPRRKLSEFPEHRNEKTDGAWARNRRPLFSRFVRNVAPLFRRWESRRRSSKYFHGTTSKARSIKDDARLSSLEYLFSCCKCKSFFLFLSPSRTTDRPVKFSSIYEVQTGETRRKVVLHLYPISAAGG